MERSRFERLVFWGQQWMHMRADSWSLSLSSSSSSSDDNMSLDSFGGNEANTSVIFHGIHRIASRLFGGMEDTTIQFGQRLLISDFNDAQCVDEFRFRKEDLQLVADSLWPKIGLFLDGDKERIVVDNYYTAPYETCLLLTLYRYSRPRRLRPDCERFFGMRKSHCSAVIKTFSEAFYKVAIPYLNNPAMWHPRMPFYAQKIYQKCGLLTNIWGFLDATIRRTCRSIRFQQLLYTKYRKCHGIKFQIVMTPDGFIACLHGPSIGKCNDSRVLHESGLLNQLRELMPLDASNGPVYALFSDLIYPECPHLLKGFVHPPPNSPQAVFNRMMSASRVCVEWGFNEIVQQWSFLNFRSSMRIFLEPIAQYYINAAFLCNLRNCFYGSETATYFDIARPLSLEEYLALVVP
jgi:DDE superfamily endonuclease